MNVRSLATRISLVLAATLCMPLGALAAGHGGRFEKMDRALKAAASSGNPSAQRVIIQTRSAAARAALKKALLAHGDIVESEHPSINALTVIVHGDDLTALDLDQNVTDLSSDAEVTVTGHVTGTKDTKAAKLRRTGRSTKNSKFNTAPLQPTTLRETLGVDSTPYTGLGIGVAIIDSGIDPNRDLADNIAGFWDFTKGGVPAIAYDDYGHGTHVAGLIASDGAMSQGEFRGVAPGVRLYGLKVLDKNGRGRSSDVLKAIDFAVANRARLGIDVINLSLGHPILEPAASDPLVQAVERAVHEGIVVVVAAGNVGADQDGNIGYAGIASPGNSPSALTVGAVDTKDTAAHGDDRVAWFSSRGPTWFDGYAKPDVVAAGVGLVSDAPKSAQLYLTYPSLLSQQKGRTKFAVLSGTSMAAAVATGAVSLVLEAGRVYYLGAPMTPNTVKAVMQFSALPVVNDGGDEFDALSQGTGEINPLGGIQIAQALNPLKPVGAKWLSTAIDPNTFIGGTLEPWSQEILWDNKDISNTTVLNTHQPIFDQNIVWGTARFDGDNIVWGTAADIDNIVWGTNIVWATNLVYSDRVIGELLKDGDNIVWGTVRSSDGDNIVWGTLLKDGDNIVWGTMRQLDGDNIVWGTLKSDGDNIVWGTSLKDGDNIVWGTMTTVKKDVDNIVWGTMALLTGGVK